MKIHPIFMLIIFGGSLFCPMQGLSGSENPLESMRIHNSLAGRGYAIQVMDETWAESGRMVFWGRKARPGIGADALHPVLFNSKTDQFTDLIPPEEMVKLIPVDGAQRVIEIAADRTADKIVFNYVKNLVNSQGFITELFVYDVKNKRVILRSTDSRYHTNLAISPDGRRLAFCSQPPDWIMWGINYGKPCGQVDLMDIETARISTAASAVSGGHMQASLYWSPDSKFVVFAHAKVEGDQRSQVLIKWDAERQEKSEFTLEGKRKFQSGLKILPDNRILVFSSREIFTLDRDFKFAKTHHAGSALNSFVTSGTTVRFNDRGNDPGPGFGSPKEIRIE